MKICIVAAGLATRLQPLTNYIPKFLINIGKQTGLVEIVNYWQEHSTEFVIIVHPKYETLVRSYFDMYFKNTNIKLEIRTIDTALGTAHTIDTVLGNDFDGEEILFTWCDIIPKAKIDFNQVDEASAHGDGITVFTVDNGLNRYKFHDNTLIQSSVGDVVGLYKVQNYKSFAGQYVEGQDFADVLSKRFLNKFELVDGIIDFGDKEKLFDVQKQADEAREFNKIEFIGDLVKKTPLQEHGKKLIKQEVDWYKKVFDSGIDVNVPKVYPSMDHTEMVMERIVGVSIYKAFQYMPIVKKLNVLFDLFLNLNKLHDVKIPVDQSVIFADIEKEAFTKLISRYNEIKEVIESFGPIDTVNGFKLSDTPTGIITRLHEKLKSFYTNTEEYSLIHGDLQMSNSMVDSRDKSVAFIDPRGYFGNTMLYGLKDYDIAKVLYSLSGYDLFNSSKNFYIADISGTTIEFKIPSPVTKAEFEKIKQKGYFHEVHWVWLAVIWIGLAQYVRNDPIKSLAAHYHGLVLASKVLNGDLTLR